MLMSLLLTAIATTNGSVACGTSREIPASEILGLIRSGMPVYYDNVTVWGELNLTGYGQVKNYLVIKNSTIEDANFDMTTFEKGIDFSGTDCRNVSFRGTTFSDFADFSDTSFLQTRFIDANFGGWAHFSGSLFRENASFYDSKFRDSALFSGARFSGDANFGYAEFDSDAFFSNVTFLANADFNGAVFRGQSGFNSANFTRDANFMLSEFLYGPFANALFWGQVHFNFARFHRPTSFSGATFFDEADFSLARFDDWVYFRESHFLSNATFYAVSFEGPVTFRDSNFEGELVLMGSQMHTLVMDNSTFSPGAKIFLDDAGFDRLNVPWSSIKDRIEYSGAVYSGLLKNYRELQWFDDYNDCYYSYRRLSIPEEPMSPMKILDYLSWIFYGFGVKPQIPMIWSVFITILFGSIFSVKKSLRKFVRIESIDLVPSKEGMLEARIQTRLIEKPIQFPDPFLFSLANFTSGWTTFLYPFTDFKTTGGHSNLAIGERILGSVFISLILAAIIRTYLVR